MFEEQIARVRRTQAEFEFELARTLDPYRLNSLLHKHSLSMQALKADASVMVRELEELTAVSDDIDKKENLTPGESGDSPEFTEDKDDLDDSARPETAGPAIERDDESYMGRLLRAKRRAKEKKDGDET